MVSNNVLQFPSLFVATAPINEEQSQSYIENIRYAHINGSTEAITDVLTDFMEAGCFDLDKADVRMYILFIETLRSLLCSCYGLNHPLQEIAKLVVTESNGEMFFDAETLIAKNKEKISEIIEKEIIK